MSWHSLTVTRVLQEGPRDRSFELEPATSEAQHFRFEPGQYLVLRDPKDAQPADMYYALSGGPEADGRLRITVRRAGPGSLRMYEQPVGAVLHARAPQGDARIDSPPGSTLLLLAAGAGAAPHRASLLHRVESGRQDPVWLFLCAAAPDELLFHDEFSRLARQCPWLQLRPIVTRPTPAWTGPVGRLGAAQLAPALTRPATTHVHACGPRGFVQAMFALAQGAGVPPAQCQEP